MLWKFNRNTADKTLFQVQWIQNERMVRARLFPLTWNKFVLAGKLPLISLLYFESIELDF